MTALSMRMLDSQVSAKPQRLVVGGVTEDDSALRGQDSFDVGINDLPAVPRRLLTTLLYAFEPGRPISLYEAQMALGDDHMYAEATLAALIDEGDVDRPSDGLWVRTGATPNPYLLGARITYPYAFVGLTALSLHRDARGIPAEVLICSPDGFMDFEYAGVSYRSVGDWFDEDVSRVLIGNGPVRPWAEVPLGLLSSYEPVAVGTLERTLVDAVRDPTDGMDASDLVALIGSVPVVEPRGILRAFDHTDDPQLPGRVALLLELLGVAERQPDVMRAVRSRSGVIGRRRT